MFLFNVTTDELEDRARPLAGRAPGLEEEEDPETGVPEEEALDQDGMDGLSPARGHREGEDPALLTQVTVSYTHLTLPTTPYV